MGLLNNSDNTFRQIREPDYFDSGQPQFAGEHQIIFQSHLNGIDNIYALDTETGLTRQLTRSKFGAAHPDYDTQSHSLLFNDFISEGMNLAHINLDTVNATGRGIMENTFTKIVRARDRERM